MTPSLLLPSDALFSAYALTDSFLGLACVDGCVSALLDDAPACPIPYFTAQLASPLASTRVGELLPLTLLSSSIDGVGSEGLQALIGFDTIEGLPPRSVSRLHAASEPLYDVPDTEGSGEEDNNGDADLEELASLLPTDDSVATSRAVLPPSHEAAVNHEASQQWPLQWPRRQGAGQIATRVLGLAPLPGTQDGGWRQEGPYGPLARPPLLGPHRRDAIVGAAPLRHHDDEWNHHPPHPHPHHHPHHQGQQQGQGQGQRGQGFGHWGAVGGWRGGTGGGSCCHPPRSSPTRPRAHSRRSATASPTSPIIRPTGIKPTGAHRGRGR